MSTKGYELKVEARNVFGKNNSRRARKDGMIPAIIYSKGKEPCAVFVKSNEWEILSHHDLSIVTLNDGKNETAAIVKEVQTNFLKGYVVHIDFMEVNLQEEIHSEVAVHTHGIARGTTQGGVFELELHVLDVVCKAADLPEKIMVDISNLEVGDSVMVKDLVLPDGVKVLNDPETIVAHVAHVKEEAEAEAAPAAEGAEPEVITAKDPNAKEAAPAK